jgi:hypothetical protein
MRTHAKTIAPLAQKTSASAWLLCMIAWEEAEWHFRNKREPATEMSPRRLAPATSMQRTGRFDHGLVLADAPWLASGHSTCRCPDCKGSLASPRRIENAERCAP